MPKVEAGHFPRHLDALLPSVALERMTIERLRPPRLAVFDADGTRVLLETSGDFPNVRAIETMLTRVAASAAGLRPIFL
jgi:hypothetical protein